MADDPQSPILDYNAPEQHMRRGWPSPLMTTAILVGWILLLGGLLWPGVGGHRENSRRIACGAHLRQLGQALALYASDNGGRLPPRLDHLLSDPNLPATIFICPSTSDTPPTGPTTQALIASLNQPGRCSYVYFGGSISGTPTADLVLVMENAANHSGQGMNILFGDGHVEWADPKEAARIRAELLAGHNPPRPAK